MPQCALVLCAGLVVCGVARGGVGRVFQGVHSKRPAVLGPYTTVHSSALCECVPCCAQHPAGCSQQVLGAVRGMVVCRCDLDCSGTQSGKPYACSLRPALSLCRQSKMRACMCVRMCVHVCLNVPPATRRLDRATARSAGMPPSLWQRCVCVCVCVCVCLRRAVRQHNTRGDDDDPCTALLGGRRS
jgi:hypothetical protein